MLKPYSSRMALILSPPVLERHVLSVLSVRQTDKFGSGSDRRIRGGYGLNIGILEIPSTPIFCKGYCV